MADRVFGLTGVRVGFTLDVLLNGEQLDEPVADPGGWLPWFDIHSETTVAPGSPVTAAWANDHHLDLFVVSTARSVVSTWWDAGVCPNYRQAGWFSIGSETRFNPGTPITALWANANHLDLFAVTSEGFAESIWWEPSGYRAAGWFAIHPETRFQPGTRITAIWATQNHLDLFAVDVDGIARTIWWDRSEPAGFNPQGWIPIHPETRSVPGGTLTALWSNSDHLDLFMVTIEQTVSSIWWDRNEASGYRAAGWFPIGNAAVFQPGAPVAALWAPAPAVHHLDLFTTDSHGLVRGIWWEPSGFRPGGWFAIIDPKVSVTFPPGAALSATWISHSELLLTACDTSGSVRGANWQSDWHGWFPIRAEFKGVPGSAITALLSPDPNHLDLFAADSRGVVDSTYYRFKVNDTYIARPERAGDWLGKTAAVLAIQGFIPEIGSGGPDENRIKTKAFYWSGWLATGIPVFYDVSPGYDAHVVFPGTDSYGHTDFWRGTLRGGWSDRFRGLIYNTWNGYTEGYVAMPSLEYGNDDWVWIQELFSQVK